MVKVINPSVEILTPLDGIYICKFIERCARNCYKSEGNITETSYQNMLKKLIELDHTAMLEHFNITAKLTTDTGVLKELTRHRMASYAVESTRYCQYNKDKFGNEITFIKPCHIQEGTNEYQLWYNCMVDIEKYYNIMAELGCKPDQLRMLLPHSTKTDIIITANIREWRHILKLRTAKAAHPTIQEIMNLVKNEFQSKIPILFDNI